MSNLELCEQDRIIYQNMLVILSYVSDIGFEQHRNVFLTCKVVLGFGILSLCTLVPFDDISSIIYEAFIINNPDICLYSSLMVTLSMPIKQT